MHALPEIFRLSCSVSPCSPASDSVNGEGNAVVRYPSQVPQGQRVETSCSTDSDCRNGDGRNMTFSACICCGDYGRSREAIVFFVGEVGVRGRLLDDAVSDARQPVSPQRREGRGQRSRYARKTQAVQAAAAPIPAASPRSHELGQIIQVAEQVLTDRKPRCLSLRLGKPRRVRCARRETGSSNVPCGRIRPVLSSTLEIESKQRRRLLPVFRACRRMSTPL